MRRDDIVGVNEIKLMEGIKGWKIAKRVELNFWPLTGSKTRF